MKQLLLILLCIISVNGIRAQNADCKVLSDSLKGTYTGDCKNGKADGAGKAVGVHTYDGEFKNGLPEGKGKYTWPNGDYYYGAWKKGLKDGKGELHHFENGVEKLTAGYWKKGNYRGEYEHPYLITNTTSDIGRLEVEKMSDKEATVTINVESLVNTPTLQGSTLMTAHQVTRGQYVSKSSNNLSSNKEVTVFRGVIFPFRCIFNFGNSILEIEFFEKGAWNVSVPIGK
ncbi:MAG: hypothetical protein JNM14_08670 [Ferruginibacter sp.]|nr:hypothetical protein [Ferruginibacter sp.]